MTRTLPALLLIVVLVGAAAAVVPRLTERDAMTLALNGDLGALRDTAGPNGWGLTYAWDAYQDGSVNPESTAYAITTALALGAFLDAHDVGPDERAIAEAWNECCWTGEWWWYSDRPADAIDTANSNAMMAGVMQRLGYTEQADAAVRHLVATGPDWPYSSRGGTNDARHRGYIGCGLMTYRAFGGSVEIPWTLPVGDRCSPQLTP